MAKTKKSKELELTASDYNTLARYNEDSFKLQLKAFRPDIFVLMDLIDTTGINYYILFQVIRHLSNISMGNKYGKVTIEVENGTATFVRGEESTKLNEPLVKKDNIFD